jgi:hypothetical protein
MLYEVTVSRRPACEGSASPVGPDNEDSVRTLLNPAGHAKKSELSQGCESQTPNGNDAKSNAMKFTKTESNTAKTRMVTNFNIVTYDIENRATSLAKQGSVFDS